MHLYPHAIDPHDHGEHNHDAAIITGLEVLAGIFIFFLIEKIVHLAGAGHAHGNNTDHKSGKEITIITTSAFTSQQ